MQKWYCTSAKFRPNFDQLPCETTGMMDELTYDQFVALLRSALHYLFDPVHLRRSPLVALLGLSGEFDQAAALQQRLVATIRELKPPDAEPPQSRAWRIYDTLHLQYVRQLARDVVATQLGISERQMRREQRLAIEALAQQLWRPAAPSDQAGEDRPADRQVATNPPPDPTQTLTKELSWLRTPAAEERVPCAQHSKMFSRWRSRWPGSGMSRYTTNCPTSWPICQSHRWRCAAFCSPC